MNAEIPAKFAYLRCLFPTGRFEIGRLTLALIAGAVFVSLLTHFGADHEATGWFTLTEYWAMKGGVDWKNDLPEIWHGQVWRLFTPFFLHFGIVHLLINVVLISMLGTFIESRQGAVTLALLVVGIEVVSNLIQYHFRGPAFGGMSGVVAGLLGYVWMRGTFDPVPGLQIDKLVLWVLVIYTLAGILGFAGRMARVGHGAGFTIGLGWGVISGMIRRRKSPQAQDGDSPSKPH